MLRKAEPAQARHGEQRRIDLAAFELFEPRADIAAQQRDAEIGPHPTQLRLPAQRRGADERAERQVAPGAARWEMKASRTSSRGR